MNKNLNKIKKQKISLFPKSKNFEKVKLHQNINIRLKSLYNSKRLDKPYDILVNFKEL